MTGSPLSDEELACLPVSYGTATGMLERGQVTSDETVLVTGDSGGVGLALVRLASARGAHVVALTTAARQGAIAPRIAARYPLSETHAAQRDLLTHTHVGKVVIQP
jgi:NADPH:quinone reductase-like Zn-dependent oxidoreductase